MKDLETKGEITEESKSTQTKTSTKTEISEKDTKSIEVVEKEEVEIGAEVVEETVVETVEETILEIVEEPITEVVEETVVETVEETIVEAVEEQVAEVVTETIVEVPEELDAEVTTETIVESVEELVAEVIEEPISVETKEENAPKNEEQEINLPKDNIEDIQAQEPEKVVVAEDIIEGATAKEEPVTPDTKEETLIVAEVPEKEAVVENASTKDLDSEEGSEPVLSEVPDEVPEEEVVDYTTFSKEELVNVLADKLENVSISDLRNYVDHIKGVFYKQHKLEVDELRKAFMAEGGDPAEFVFEGDPLEEKFKVLINKYKSLKAEHNRNIEQEKENNLKKKYEIIEEIKALINGKESLNKTFNDFHELQNKWREIGLVPQLEVKNMWETYHHCVEQFYDYVKINRELRDLDFKKNLDAKILLCEKADQLLLEPSVVKAFKTLQKLHDNWKEIGPVSNEKGEEIWERFKDTTSKINKLHQDYFEELKEEQVNNLVAKTALCEKAEELANEVISSHNEWDAKSNEIVELQKLWKTIGFATKKDNNKIYERFRSACDLFFTNKREFYKASKTVQDDNLQLKTELCLQAESLKDSNDWKKTSNELIRLQKEWKEIGPVQRKISDQIWKRFRAACNEFFENKGKYFSNIDQEYDANLKKKRELIELVKSFVHKENVNDNLNALNEIQKEWANVGHVPYKMKDGIQKEFRDAINTQFDALNIDKVKRSAYVYKQRVENLADGNNSRKSIRFERDKVIDRIKHLEDDIKILGNNIGFFAKTKGAEGLINDVNKKIENAKEQIKIEKQKLDMLDKVDE